MRKIRTGIIGLGRLGSRHAQDIAFQIPEAELAAACSVVPQELELARSWGVPLLYDNYSQMIQEADIDAVAIVSPSPLHADHIIEALEAGKHVFVEKPLAVTVEDCLRVEAAVAAHPDQVFFLGFMRRYDPSYAEAKRKIQAGEIGKPFLFRGVSCDPDSAIDGFIRFAPTSGGNYLDMAIHDIDLMLWFMEDDVRTIAACGGAYKHPEVAAYGGDNAFAMMQFKNGATAFLHAGRTAAHGYQVETEIVGTEGSIRIAGIPRKDALEIYNHHGVVVECQQHFSERFTEAFLIEKRDFYRCIREKTQPAITAHDGTRATRIGFAATKAYETGKLLILE